MRTRLLGLLVALAGAAAMAGEKARPLPPPSESKISFGKDVKVILAHNCFECHSGGKKKGGLAMVSRESSKSLRARRPSRCTEEALPSTSMAARMASLATGRKGLVALWSR